MNAKPMSSLRPILSLVCLFIYLAASSPAAYAQAGGEITPKGIVYPRYTDANRPTGPLTIGTTIYNTGQNTHQYWNGSSWTNVSTPGSGPWIINSNDVYLNNNNRVGINTATPTATLEVQGTSFSVSRVHTITSAPATNTYIMPYNGTLATITDSSANILDPGGNGNINGTSNNASHVSIQVLNAIGFRLTFESFDFGNQTNSSDYQLILSTSSDINDESSYLAKLSFLQNTYPNKPFNLNGGFFILHFKALAGAPSVPGFKLRYQALYPVSIPFQPYSEAVGGGLKFNTQVLSFEGNNSRATGQYSTALGFFSRSTNHSSTAIGHQSHASGRYSTAMGAGGNTKGYDYSFSIGGGISPNRAGNDKESQMKMHFEEIRLETGTNGDFTITPTQITTNNSISVFGNNTVNLNGYGFLNRTGPTGIAPSAASVPFSIYASGRIIGSEFNAFSDARHKRLRSRSRGDTDLAQLNRLAVSRYTFIDTVQKGNQEQLGFIAQEVEQAVPEAVSKIVDYIPSVYAMAERVSYDSAAHTLTVRTQQPHGFAAAEDIKVITAQEEHKVRVGTLIDAHTFRLNGWQKATAELFVFGKSVSDFRTVDYNRLFTMGISAIQELSRRVEQLEKENAQLKAQNDELSQMKSDIATLKNLLLKAELPEKSAEK
ncbi:tail fiber domain-containing protein [Runella aurantiaca]|uniref:Peptidase S74 domain-containing protein n=1 Tax=Runella aurantiaca TaxID=2282308 RepID=A0A369IFG2_9BACT|nr:tail fiber domain-containing protein [Runella aurantiaca]RDB06233.1 hypothetical protein DVG78_10420 [Runella aurantiaca]